MSKGNITVELKYSDQSLEWFYDIETWTLEDNYVHFYKDGNEHIIIPFLNIRYMRFY